MQALVSVRTLPPLLLAVLLVLLLRTFRQCATRRPNPGAHVLQDAAGAVASLTEHGVC